MIDELKAFLLRGNVVDLAVAVIIGVAFGAIVTAVVDGIVGPLIALIVGEPDFTAWTVEVSGTQFLVGSVIGAIINFVAVGIVLFFVVKAANRASQARKKTVEVEGEPEPEITEDVALLREIRDALVSRPPA